MLRFARRLTVCLGAILAFGLLAPSVLAAERYFTGTAGASWADPANWSETSGGTGGASVPGSGDVAIFDGSSPSCALSGNVTVDGVRLMAGYAGVLDAGAYALTVNYAAGSGLLSVAGGELKLGTGTHTVKGNLSHTGGAITAQTSKVQFLAPDAASITISGAVVLNDVKFYHSNSGSSHKTVNVNSLVTANGSLEVCGYDVGGWHLYLNGGGEIIAKGEILGNGKVVRGNTSLTVAGDAADQGQTNLWGAPRGCTRWTSLSGPWSTRALSGSATPRPAATRS